MKELIGRTLTGLTLSDNQRILTFHTSTGKVVYEAEGDCCSESWFAYLLGDFIGEVIAVAEKEERRVEPSRQEVDLVYGYILTIKEPFCSRIERADVELRNSSNGYYGGWCTYRKDLSRER